MDRNRRITSGEQRTRVTSKENSPGMRPGRRGRRGGAGWPRDYPFQPQLLGAFGRDTQANISERGQTEFRVLKEASAR